MANIKKRGNFYRAQVWRRGVRKSAAFDIHDEAETWAAKIESDIGRGIHIDFGLAEKTPVSTVLETYKVKILPKKRSIRRRIVEIKQFNRKLGRTKLAQLSATPPGRVPRRSSATSRATNHAPRIEPTASRHP